MYKLTCAHACITCCMLSIRTTVLAVSLNCVECRHGGVGYDAHLDVVADGLCSALYCLLVDYLRNNHTG